MVVSSAAVFDPPVTRLPAVTAALLTRPSIGAVMRVNSRLSFAESTAARAAATSAFASREALMRESYSSRETALMSTQLLAARCIGGSQLGACYGARQLSFGLRQLGAIRTRVDDEQQVAFTHRAALGEVHALDVAGDARAHFDRLDRFEPAGEFIPLRDVALERGRDGNLRRGGLRHSRRVAPAAAQSDQRSNQRTGYGEGGRQRTNVKSGHTILHSVSLETRQRRAIRHLDHPAGLLTTVCQESATVARRFATWAQL